MSSPPTANAQPAHPPASPGKLVLLGWDAATWDVLQPWVQQGKLPHLARLMQRGSHMVLQSTPLPISPAAWSTLITGQNPARHGVFDWFQARPDSYDVDYVHTGQLRARPIWEYFQAAGKRIGVINLPMVYPAVPLEGVMLAGLAAPHPHATGFSYPADLIHEIEAEFGPYPLITTEMFRYGREPQYIQGILKRVEYQRRLIHYLMDQHPCDCYLFVFMQTDHVQHKFWRYLDLDHPLHNRHRDAQFHDGIFLVYQALDDVLGDVVERCGPDTTCFVFSDHGAGPAHGTVFLNRWLASRGWLHLKRDAPTRAASWLAKTDLPLRSYRLLANMGLGQLATLVPKKLRSQALQSFHSTHTIDWSRTRAYATGYFGQIFINLQGRQPAGIVAPGSEYEDLVAQILAGLRSLRHPHTGELLITDLHRREELLHGPYLEQSADILFSLQHYLYDSAEKFGLESTSLLGISEYENSGTHRPAGMLAVAGPGVAARGRLAPIQAADLLPTVLALAGLPVPQHLDGSVVRAALDDATVQQMTYQAADAPAEAAHSSDTPQMDAAEQHQLEARLRDLGYLG